MIVGMNKGSHSNKSATETGSRQLSSHYDYNGYHDHKDYDDLE